LTTGEYTMIPDDWQPPPPDLAAAKQKAMEALRTDGPYAAQHRLARFYDTDGDYAGASFAQLGPTDPIDITPADLLATRLGLTQWRSYQVDWQVFRSLIGDPDIIAAIDVMSKATAAAAAGRRLQEDQSCLR